MYGVLVRAAPQAVFVALVSAAGSRVLQPLVDLMLQEGAKDDLLISGLQTASDNFVLVGILALLLTILAAAVIESRGGR